MDRQPPSSRPQSSVARPSRSANPPNWVREDEQRLGSSQSPFSFGMFPSIWGFPNDSPSRNQDESLFSTLSPFVWRDQQPTSSLQAPKPPALRQRDTNIQVKPSASGKAELYKVKKPDNFPPKPDTSGVDGNWRTKKSLGRQGLQESGEVALDDAPDISTSEDLDSRGAWRDVVKKSSSPAVTSNAPPSNAKKTGGTEEMEGEVLLWVPNSTWSDANDQSVHKEKEKPLIAPTAEEMKSKAPPSASITSMSKKPVGPQPVGIIPGNHAKTNLPPPLPPFFGEANTDASSIVVGSSHRVANSDHQIQDRLSKLKSIANKGYGVVPITNSFTIRNSQTKTIERKAASLLDPLTPPSSPGNDESEDMLNNEIMNTPIRKQSAKNIAPPSPTLPTAEELGTKGLVLYQVGFATGRQGLFQGLSMSRSGESISSLMDQFVVLNQDDGVDIGILRGYEPLTELVPRIPEVPFMRIIRRARKGEIERLEVKAREEAFMIESAHNLLRTRPNLAHMKVQYCEFQYDRNKLVVYADMTQWVLFNEFVKSLHAACEAEFGYQARIFIQRRFTGHTLGSSENKW